MVFLKKDYAQIAPESEWGEEVYRMRGDAKIPILWSGSTLKIGGPATGNDVFLSKDRWEDIRIAYGYF